MSNPWPLCILTLFLVGCEAQGAIYVLNAGASVNSSGNGTAFVYSDYFNQALNTTANATFLDVCAGATCLKAVTGGGLSLAQIAANIGNWSSDKPSYALVTHLQTANTTANSAQTGVSQINTTVGAHTTSLSQLNTSKAQTGSSTACGGTDKETSVTLNAAGVPTTTSAADQTSSAGLTNSTTVYYNTTNSTQYLNMSQLWIVLSANTKYEVDCLLFQSSAAATTGEQLQINLTGTPLNVTLTLLTASSATVWSPYFGTSATTNAFADAGSAGTNVPSAGTIIGRIITGANPVGVTYFLKSEVSASNVVIQTGSRCTYTSYT